MFLGVAGKARELHDLGCVPSRDSPDFSVVSTLLMRFAHTNKQILAWALYDWANSAYATVVMAGFFPIFFRDFWSYGQESSTITFYLGLANSLASLLIMLIAPFLGAVSDSGGNRKHFLAVFALLGLVMTASFYWIPQGETRLAVVVYVLATLGFMGSNVFYDALIVVVAPRRHFDAVSALGFGLGYLGGGLLFTLCVLMSLFPAAFGLKDATLAVRCSFLLVALWWAIFSIPIFMNVRDTPPRVCLSPGRAVLDGIFQVKHTFMYIRQFRTVGLFLLAYWLYIDGVDTIVRMAVDYGLALGFGRDDLILALLITQFVGFPAAIVFGRLGERLGTKTGIFIAIGIYALVTIWGSMMEETWEFFGIAVAIGLVQGGIQSLSRALYARLIPPNRAAEFFGFYNMLGKFAAVVGPVMVGWVGVLSGSPRLGILSILCLFFAGAILLWFVNSEGGGDKAVDQGI